MNRKDEQETTSTYDNVKQLIDFMKVMKISRKSFVFSMALSFFAVFLNLITIRLLMDLLRGMIVRDFEFIRSVAGFKSVVALFPGMFETSSSLFVLLIATMFFLTFVVRVLQ